MSTFSSKLKIIAFISARLPPRCQLLTIFWRCPDAVAVPIAKVLHWDDRQVFLWFATKIQVEVSLGVSEMQRSVLIGKRIFYGCYLRMPSTEQNNRKPHSLGLFGLGGGGGGMDGRKVPASRTSLIFKQYLPHMATFAKIYRRTRFWILHQPYQLLPWQPRFDARPCLLKFSLF